MPIYKKVNKAFFRKWNSDMAYVLGFFAADGSMIANNRGAYFIEFDITDKEILQKIKRILCSNHKISVRDRGRPNCKVSYRLQIGSKEMFHDLLELGFTSSKSKIIAFPRIPDIFLRDFVRGYFDGDGCVYFKKHYIKSRGKERWVFSSRFTSGSRKFLEGLFLSLRKYVKGGYIYTKNSGFELVFSHKDSLALFKFLYHNNCHGLYLKRKYKLFRKAIETLYGKEKQMRA